MDNLLRPVDAARRLGVSTGTLRRWDKAKRLHVVRTPGGQRRIREHEVLRLQGELERRAPVLYARVSTHGQREDLERQKELLLRTHPGGELHWDVRSGLKFDRKGFREVLRAVQERRVSRVVVVHEDRLSRFGVDLLREVFAGYGTTLEVLVPKPRETPEHELAQDLIAIITSFSARLYGLRSHKTQKLLATARALVRDP